MAPRSTLPDQPRSHFNARYSRMLLLKNQSVTHTSSGSGFTIVEILVAAVLLAVVAGGTAATMVIGNRTSQRAGLQTQLDALIDQDLSAIRTLNDRYTCCPGSCTATASAISAAVSAGDCSVNTPGNENYYSPNQVSTNPAAATTATTAFRTACGNGTITTNFITQIPALPTAPAGSTLTRTAPTQVDAAAHRLQWTYTGSINGQVAVTRVVNLTPTVAAWCP